MSGARPWALLPADPVLDPNRPVLPNAEVFGADLTGPATAILGAVWGLFLILATVRLFAALAAAKAAHKNGAADDLFSATAKIRTAGIALALLMCAAAVVGAYIAFANRIAS